MMDKDNYLNCLVETMSLSIPTLRLPSRAKFWKKRSSADLTDLDPSYRATYLGNVLTGWAKGDGCMDKPLATLWKNHVGIDKPNIVMKVAVCPSGLKAVTKEHGLTEYWANRITYCASDPAYPRVFCWIYRHEGRKLKQELRCHAVLCPSASKARLMAERLKQRLHQALVDFKKEKVWRQNARLSLANSVYDNPTMPHRKMLLQTGSLNYRPPLDRSKAAPKLKMIEEVVNEEREEEEEEEIFHHPPTATPSASTLDQTRTAKGCDDFRKLSRLSPDAFPPLPCTAAAAAGDGTASTSERESLSCASVDNVSLASTVSTVIESTSSLINEHPSAANATSVNTFLPPPSDVGSTDCSEDEEEEEDLITNYLESLSMVYPCPNPEKNICNKSKEGASSITYNEILSCKEELHVDDEKMPSSDQDTISDESGYSEESSATTASSARPPAIVYIDSIPKTEETCLETHIRPEDGDQTVRGVLMSEFSDTEKLLYLERSRQVALVGPIQLDFLQRGLPDFCINI